MEDAPQGQRNSNRRDRVARCGIGYPAGISEKGEDGDEWVTRKWELKQREAEFEGGGSEWKAQERGGPTRAEKTGVQRRAAFSPVLASPERAAAWDGPGCCSEETEGMRARTNQRMLCTAKHGCEFLGEEGKGADAGAGWHLRRDFLCPGELAPQGSAGASTRRKLMSSREPPTERGGRTWKVVRRSRCSTVARRLGVAS